MDRKLQVGVIGAGRIGRVHAENVNKFLGEKAEIGAVADLFADNIAHWAHLSGIKKVYGDCENILGDPQIEAVLICSSTHTHCELIIESARRGKHIFCEKPIDFDESKIRIALEEVSKAGVKFQIGFQRRFDRHFGKLKEMLGEKKIGEPQIIKITSRDPEPPPLDYIKVSGGIFLDMSIHDFDMARFLLDSEIEEVFAVGAVLIDPAIAAAGDIDTALISLKFRNGALGVIDNSRKAVYGYDQRVELFGSEGMLRADNERPANIDHSTSAGVTGEKPHHFFMERYREAYLKEIEAFIDCVINDTAPVVTGIDGLESVLAGLAAQRSLREGRPVTIKR